MDDLEPGDQEKAVLVWVGDPEQVLASKAGLAVTEASDGQVLEAESDDPAAELALEAGLAVTEASDGQVLEAESDDPAWAGTDGQVLEAESDDPAWAGTDGQVLGQEDDPESGDLDCRDFLDSPGLESEGDVAQGFLDSRAVAGGDRAWEGDLVQDFLDLGCLGMEAE
ncbi:MAG: hypothetical protein H7222_07035, partial [Methylotenera sp.]|nr:hypothetical protein [Oligoflexia bacterium]